MHIKINKRLSKGIILKNFGLVFSQNFSLLGYLKSFHYNVKYYSNYYASINLLDINKLGLLI